MEAKAPNNTTWSRRALISLLFGHLLGLIGCAQIPDGTERRERATDLAVSHGWGPLAWGAGGFTLQGFLAPEPVAGRPLVLFIEGDGLAWLTPTTPALDPTPLAPVALQLALAHRGGPAAYLGRPCQYRLAESPACQERHWTQDRFGPEVIAATQSAIDQIKSRTGAQRLVLVGYSGGGAVAALAASERRDVVGLITVAGNLDHQAWTRFHRLTPLSGSLNAATQAWRLSHIKQWHVVGGRDTVMPPMLAHQWPRAFTGTDLSRLQVVPEAEHTCCWDQRWPAIWAAFEAP